MRSAAWPRVSDVQAVAVALVTVGAISVRALFHRQPRAVLRLANGGFSIKSAVAVRARSRDCPIDALLHQRLPGVHGSRGPRRGRVVLRSNCLAVRLRCSGHQTPRLPAFTRQRGGDDSGSELARPCAPNAPQRCPDSTIGLVIPTAGETVTRTAMDKVPRHERRRPVAEPAR